MRRAAGAASLLLLLVPVSSCAGGEPTSDRGQADGSTSSSSPGGEHDGHAMDDSGSMDAASAPPEAADWNAADAAYFSMMVAHHSQAIDMTELVPERVSDPRVRSIAEAIDVGQGREVIVMATWLVEHGQPEPTPESVAAMTSMGSMTMPGMLDPEQLAELAAADGPTFDRLFLESMVRHHEGALLMAQDVLGAGEDVRVAQMAADVVAGQGAEIRRMQDLLGELP